MSEINFNIVSPISANKNIEDDHPQKIELEHFPQGVRTDSLYGNASNYAITEHIKVEVSGLELSAGQVNDSISMLETIGGLSNEILFALNQMRGLAVQAAGKDLPVKDRAALDLEFGQLFAEIESIAVDSDWGSMTIMSGSDREAEALVSSALAGERLSGKVEDQAKSVTLKSWDPSTAIRANVVQQTVDPVTGLQNVRGNQFTPDGLIDGGDELPLGNSKMLDYDLSGNDNSITGGAAYQSARSTETQSFGSAVLWAGNPPPGDGNPRRLNILSSINAEYVLTNIDKAISAASDERDRLTTYISKLESAGDHLTNTTAPQRRSHSRIEGSGFASEVSRNAISAQADSGLLAQANAGNEAVLTFLMK
jgi:flagellin-like hook-associated protein FlgL